MAARLEADEAQRRTLLADISHELRTPLAVITGNLEAIVDGVYPADAAHLTPILEETRVLERLIDDLRTVALSEAGTLPLHPEPTDPDVLIGDVVRSFGPAAAAAGVDARDGASTTTCRSSRSTRCGSARCSPTSSPTPSATRRPAARSRSAARRRRGALAPAASRDTGPGIDPALLPHVFDRFVKGEASRGSGLGLAIARGLVEAHGGTIDGRRRRPAAGRRSWSRCRRPTGA